MGVMASMALMPVCIGSLTGWRAMIDGAWISTRRMMAPVMGPLPSTGSPRAFTTRPSMASPTGTDRMRPVDFTVWPSSMPSASPSTTAPMESSSRFRARPAVPSSNSRSSLTPHSGSPDTRAMPSPTWITRPTVRASSDGWKPSRCFLRAASMSAVEMVSSAMRESPREKSEKRLDLFETGADGAVDDGVVDGSDGAAQDGRVHDHLHLHLFAGGVGQGGGQAALLVGGERDGRAHRGHRAVLLGGGPLDELGDDGGQVPAPAGAHDEADERDGRRRRLRAEQVL